MMEARNQRDQTYYKSADFSSACNNTATHSETSVKLTPCPDDLGLDEREERSARESY